MSKTEQKYVIEAIDIFDDSDLSRAKIQYQTLSFISKRLPLKESVLTANMSISLRKSIKACRWTVRHLVNVKLLEEDFMDNVVKPTEMFNQFVSGLDKKIRKYEKGEQKK